MDTQNIAQEIQQLRQMLTDEVLQNEQITQLLAQLDTLREQYAQLQETYAALTGLMELPEIIRTEMEAELNGILDQEFGDILATVDAIKSGDWSSLAGSGSSEIRTQMERVLAEAGFDEDTLSEMASAARPARSARPRPRPPGPSRPPPPRTATRTRASRSNGWTVSSA